MKMMHSSSSPCSVCQMPWLVVQTLLQNLSRCSHIFPSAASDSLSIDASERGLVVNISVVSCPADVDRFRERFLVRLLSNMQHLQLLHHWHHPYGTKLLSTASKRPYYPRVADEDFTLPFFSNSEGGFNVVLGAVTS